MKQCIKAFVLYDKPRDGMFFESMEIEDSLDEFYRIIGCEYVEIRKRGIGNSVYNVICDEEKLLNDKNPIITLINPACPQRNIYGTVIIVGIETIHGDLTGIADNDIDNIRSQITMCGDVVNGESILLPKILVR